MQGEESSVEALREAGIGILVHAKRMDDAEKFAREQCANAPVDDPTPQLMLVEVVAQRARGDDPQRATQLYEGLHEKFPGYVPAWRSHAHFLLLQGKTDDALALTQRLVAIPANARSSSAWVVASSIYQLLDHALDARAAAEKAIALDPKNPKAHARLGGVALDEKDLKTAEACGNAVLELDPQNAEGLTILGAVAAAAHRPPSEVASLFSRALESDPTDVDAAAMLGSLLVHESKFDTAIRVLERTLSNVPEPPPKLITLLGIAQLRRGFTADAERTLRASLELDEKLSNTHAALAELLLGRRDLEGAKAQAERALELDPANAVALEIVDRVKKQP